MAQGQIYVEVDANSVSGGVMPMAVVSGNPEPVFGQESYGVWLLWKYDTETGKGGFTGISWYVGDDYNVLNTWFHTNEEFEAKLASEKPSNLDEYLGGWGTNDKQQFLENHKNKPGFVECFTFVNQ